MASAQTTIPSRSLWAKWWPKCYLNELGRSNQMASCSISSPLLPTFLCGNQPVSHVDLRIGKSRCAQGDEGTVRSLQCGQQGNRRHGLVHRGPQRVHGAGREGEGTKEPARRSKEVCDEAKRGAERE